MDEQKQFETFKNWVQRELKINLHSYKEKQLHRRIGTVMRSAGAANLDEYAKMIKSDETVKRIFLDYITINVTEFFRNKEIFDEFEKELVNNLYQKFGKVNIWSAACSIGAEPYSVGIILKRHGLERKGKIVATDIDDTILKKAREGNFREAEVKSVNEADRNKYFTKNGNQFKIDEGIKQMVQFKKHDLILDSYEKNFHAIICRNVTIYFKNETKNEIYRKFNESLEKGGIFFTGATESIYNPESFGFRKLSTFLYEKV